MDNHPHELKSCAPPLFDRVAVDDATPEEGCGPDLLGDYARAQDAAITRCEQFVTAHYWHLGLVLNLARRHFSRGQWGKSLQELGVDKTRAFWACAIHRTFKQQVPVEGLSVQQAYQRRDRRVGSLHRRRAAKRGRRVV